MIFDLWETLVDWAREESSAFRRAIAATTGHGEERFGELWDETYRLRETGPLKRAYRAVGVPDEALEEVIAARHEVARRTLLPREGVVETLEELRRRGFRLGLISVCT